MTRILGAICASIMLGCVVPTASHALEIGVGTHFGQGKTDEAAFASWSSAIVVDSIRDEIYWDHVERRRGVFRLDGDALRTANVMRSARARGMRPLLVLDYGNDLYGGGLPSDRSAREAFARYAAFVAETMVDSVDDFEVWNEWNMGAGSRPKVTQGSPEAYVALLAASAAAVKRANRRARIIAGAVGDDPADWSWLRRAIKAGLLEHADAVSIHLYNYMQSKDAGGVPEFLRRVQSLHALLEEAAPKRKIPILITEIGWPNHVGIGRVDPLEAGGELLSLLLALRGLPYVAGVWLYEFRDGGADAHDVEQNFGLVTHDYHPKPASRALAYALSQLKAAKIARRLDASGFSGNVLQLADGRTLLAIWRSADNRCKAASVALVGLPPSAVPEPLAFVPASAAAYAAATSTWTIPGDALPQLFRLEAGTQLSGLSLKPRCPPMSSARCALDRLRCEIE